MAHTDRRISLPSQILKHTLNATLFARARRRLHGEILGAVKGCRTAVDVAAGDDTFYLKLAALPSMQSILLNDVDREALQRGYVEHPKVRRLCSDAHGLSTQGARFDCAIIKNLLHHLSDEAAIAGLLRTIGAIARRLIVVEIENPRTTGGLPRLLHQWRSGSSTRPGRC